MKYDTLRRRGVRGEQCIDIPEHCEAILKLLCAGWRRALTFPNAHAEAGEVPITECLRTGMREALAEMPAYWRRNLTVLPGTESRSSTAVSTPDGLTDIPIFLQDIREKYDEHDPHAIIECKRVAGNDADLCRLYVVEGIDRFDSGKYAGSHSVGFMTGYLLSGDADAAVMGINRYLTRTRRGREHLQSSTAIDEPWVWSSRHPRPSRTTPIDLHHAFLGFHPIPC